MIVLIAVSESLQVVPELNPNPVQGRMGIFARANVQTEMRPTFEIVGVCSTLELANQARAAHFTTHPNCRYSQKVCGLDDFLQPAQPEVVKCILCGAVIPQGSFCTGCNAKRIEETRAADPEFPTEAEPARRATEGFGRIDTRVKVTS